MKRGLKIVIIIITILVGLPIICGLLSWLFLFPPVQIVGNSMNPTLNNNAMHFTKHVFGINRSDIVVYKNGNTLLIGRVIGIPGDTIEIKDGKVYLNNKVLDESKYLPSSVHTSDYEKTSIEDNHYFIMGDNRPQSLDSRIRGQISKNQIQRKIGTCYLYCS